MLCWCCWTCCPGEQCERHRRAASHPAHGLCGHHQRVRGLLAPPFGMECGLLGSRARVSLGLSISPDIVPAALLWYFLKWTSKMWARLSHHWHGSSRSWASRGRHSHNHWQVLLQLGHSPWTLDWNWSCEVRQGTQKKPCSHSPAAWCWFEDLSVLLLLFLVLASRASQICCLPAMCSCWSCSRCSSSWNWHSLLLLPRYRGLRCPPPSRQGRATLTLCETHLLPSSRAWSFSFSSQESCSPWSACSRVHSEVTGCSLFWKASYLSCIAMATDRIRSTSPVSSKLDVLFIISANKLLVFLAQAWQDRLLQVAPLSPRSILHLLLLPIFPASISRGPAPIPLIHRRTLLVWPQSV